MLCGFWLGVLRPSELRAIDSWYFASKSLYLDEAHNTRGLWPWEKSALHRYFKRCRMLLLMAAGGGREYLALADLGYEVDASECNPVLVDTANQLAARLGHVGQVALAEPDTVPDGPLCDGAIVGWGAYSLIQGRGRRIAFLKRLHQRVAPDSPVLLSFFHRSSSDRRDRMTAAIANVVRWLGRAERVETGDALAPNYVHYFTRHELEEELRDAGFRLVHFSVPDYAHAVARAVETRLHAQHVSEQQRRHNGRV